MSDFIELKRLAMEATPGPWEIQVSHYPESGDMIVTTDTNGWELLEMREDCPAHEANAAFIAAANPKAIMALIAENEALRKDAERYRWISENADVDCRGHVPDGDYASLDERIDASLYQEKGNG